MISLFHLRIAFSKRILMTKDSRTTKVCVVLIAFLALVVEHTLYLIPSIYQCLRLARSGIYVPLISVELVLYVYRYRYVRHEEVAMLVDWDHLHESHRIF